MAIIKMKDLRILGNSELDDKKEQLRTELRKEMGAIASGTKAENPGIIRETKKTIARINTLLREKEVQINK